MRIRLVILFLIAFEFGSSFAQNSVEPIDNQYITFAPRLGFGLHNYINFEVGGSLIAINNEPLAWGAASLYSTFIFQQENWNSGFTAKGIKVGVQSSWAIFMWGIEYKNLISGDSNFNYLSPKFGLSWLDVMNVEYAINIIEINQNKESPISSKHQLSINFSINKKLYKNVYKEIF